MRFRKGKEPVRLRRWRAENPGEVSWEALDAEVKAQLREALARDQQGVCCYCYGPAEPRARMEHIVARTRDNVLAWENLALACNGGEGLPPAEHHCDKKKHDRPLRVVHPYRNPVIELVRMSSSGRLKGFGEGDDLGVDVDETLGLNGRRPVNARKQAIASVTKDLPRRRWSSRRLAQVLVLLRERGQPIPCQAWVEQWLEHKLASR